MAQANSETQQRLKQKVANEVQEGHEQVKENSGLEDVAIPMDILAPHGSEPLVIVDTENIFGPESTVAPMDSDALLENIVPMDIFAPPDGDFPFDTNNSVTSNNFASSFEIVDSSKLMMDFISESDFKESEESLLNIIFGTPDSNTNPSALPSNPVQTLPEEITGYFIHEKSPYGNDYLPVLPRFDWPADSDGAWCYVKYTQKNKRIEERGMYYIADVEKVSALRGEGIYYIAGVDSSMLPEII